jgi:hypothetical protein
MSYAVSCPSASNRYRNEASCSKGLAYDLFQRSQQLDRELQRVVHTYVQCSKRNILLHALKTSIARSTDDRQDTHQHGDDWKATLECITLRRLYDDALLTRSRIRDHRPQTNRRARQRVDSM